MAINFLPSFKGFFIIESEYPGIDSRYIKGESFVMSGSQTRIFSDCQGFPQSDWYPTRIKNNFYGVLLLKPISVSQLKLKYDKHLLQLIIPGVLKRVLNVNNVGNAAVILALCGILLKI